MGINIARGKTDEILEEIRKSLMAYQQDHPRARIDLYRQSSASIRVRIIDPDLTDMSKRDRNDLAWRYLASVSEETQGDISMIIMVTPTELERSMANLEFEDPVPSVLCRC
jgi:hypothetical protein